MFRALRVDGYKGIGIGPVKKPWICGLSPESLASETDHQLRSRLICSHPPFGYGIYIRYELFFR